MGRASQNGREGGTEFGVWKIVGGVAWQGAGLSPRQAICRRLGRKGRQQGKGISLSQSLANQTLLGKPFSHRPVFRKTSGKIW